MTRLFQPPLPIAVTIVEAQPATLMWQQQTFHIVHIARRWRVRIWWRDIWREYYKLIVQTGARQPSTALIIIYHDLLNKSWYLQQVYD